MAEKMLRKQRIAIQKLEERVLFDAAGAAEIVDAAAAAAAVQGAEAEAQADDADDEKSSEVIAPPENAVENKGAEAEAEAEENAEAGKGAESEIIDSTELAEELADAVEDIEVEDLDDISPEDAADDIEVESDDVEVESDEVVAFADAFAVPEVETPAVEERELVIISDYVKDADKIAEQLDDNTDVLILKKGENPMDQINEYLDSKDGVKYDAIHVVSHGSAGYFLLNDSIVDADAVAEDPASWKAIGEHLTADGDIMIYGCNVAGSEDGKAMLANIADLTGADVAASVDKVGAANGWDLEYAYGIVDTENVVIDGIDYSLGNYTLVEQGSQGSGETARNWSVNLNAAGTYYGIAGSTGSFTNSDGKTEVKVTQGQFYSVTVNVTPGDGTNPPKIDYTYTAYDGQGSKEYILGLIGADSGADTIVIQKDNVVGYAELGNIVNAVNTGGLTINAEQDVTVTYESGTFTDSLAVNADNIIVTGNTVVNDGTVSLYLGAGGDINLSNITVNGGTFAVSGSIDNLTFGSVSVNKGGTFDVSNTWSNKDNIAADVTFTGSVTVNDANFSVFVGANDEFGEGAPEGSVTFNNSFTVTGSKSSSVSIQVEDAGSGPEFTQDDNILGNAGATSEARIIFKGNVALGSGSGSADVDLAATYIGFNGNLTVGSESGASDVSVSDFAQVKFSDNKTFTIKKGSHVTFEAIDRVITDEHKEGYFGDKYRIEVANLEINKNANLTINNVLMDVRGTVSHEGEINGEGSELLFRNTVGTLGGVGYNGGTVHLDSVRYENGLTDITAEDIYWGDYGNLGIYLQGNYTFAVNVLELINIQNITFINRNDDTAAFAGSNATVTMSGRFDVNGSLVSFGKENPTTIDFEVGSKVNVKYESPSQQYILGGNYYELTVTGKTEKILTGAISVGVSAPQLSELKGRYDAQMNGLTPNTDAKILARKTEHLYRGGISLGTTLKTAGNTVDFYGYTHSASDKAKIDATGSTDISNRVSYHVAHNLVNFGSAWSLVSGGAAHENGGVGPNGVTGNARGNEDYKAFFGGTYQNLTIDAMPSLPAQGGVEILGQDTITFNVDADATVKGIFAVSTLKDGPETQHHHLTVNVSSVMTFDKTAISLNDASLHFNGNVLGTIAGIKAERDTLFSNSGEMQLTFASRLESVGALETDGIAVTFNGDVDYVGSIDVYGWQSNVYYAKVTFNKGVTVDKYINTHTEYDAAKPILTFNGLVVGNATVDAYRGEFNFNYDGDQHIFAGVYDDVNISGSGVKSIIGETAIKGVFDGEDTKITINSGASLSLSFIAEDTGADPNRPDITVEEDARLSFGSENTSGMIFNGDIFVEGNVEFFGTGIYNGKITLEKTGTIAIDASADTSVFSQIINKSDIVINRDITIGVLHNYGTVTVENNQVELDVYNHNRFEGDTSFVGHLIFDLKYGTTDYSFTFGGGENEMGTANINSLVNGGKITVKNGTLNLNNFTQGDKDADSGKWTYGSEEFAIGTYGTLVLGATTTQINTGNVESPAADAYLGNIANSGVVEVAASAGNVTFAGNITNTADTNPADSKSDEGKFILANSNTRFAGNFTHNGSLTTTGTSAVTFGANSIVSGTGTIGGAAGYGGEVTFEGDTGVSQQVFRGIYNNKVTLNGRGDKLLTAQVEDGKISGDFIFNGNVVNASVMTIDIDGDSSTIEKGEHVNVVFNGNTSGTGTFRIGEEHLKLDKDYSVDVTYTNAAGSTVYAGVYDVLDVTDGNIATDITANTLKLAGTNTFNGANERNIADLVVKGNIELAENSTTTFGEFSTINNGSEQAAIFKGGKNGSVTFSTNLIGENVAVFADGLAADVTYDYTGEGTQVILNGYYINNVTLSGSAKEVRGSVTVYGALNSTASLLTVLEGSTITAAGSIDVDTIYVKEGAVLSLDLSADSVLGAENETVVVDETGTVTGKGVVLGGTLNVKGNGNTVTVYGWVDDGTAGKINVSSGVIEFAGTPEEYGFISALVSNNATLDAVIDANGRLQNLWFTVSEDALTSDLKGYFANSKFHVLEGVTLTVDYFDEKDGSNQYIITNTVEYFKVENGATLIFAMVEAGGLTGNGYKLTVNNLEVVAGGQVIVKDGSELLETLGVAPERTLEIVNTVLADGEENAAISGTGNVVVKKGTHTGDGTFNMTGGKVSYSSGVSVFDGVYYDLELNKNTITNAFEVTNKMIFSGAVTFADGANVTLNGAHFKVAATLEKGAQLTFGENATATWSEKLNNKDLIKADKGSTVTYEANALVVQGTYGDLVLNGDHEINSNFIVRGDAEFTSGIQSGSGHWTFKGNASGEINNTGTVTYDSISKINGLSGTYNNIEALTANLFLKDITLNGTLSGGWGTLTFEGDNTFADTAVANLLDGSIVVYAAGSKNILQGNYYSIKLLADKGAAEEKVLNGSLTVNGEAGILEGVVFKASSDAPATITFAGTTDGKGTVNFGADTTAVYGANAEVFGGNYHNLDIAAAHNIDLDINVAGNANFGAEMTGSGMWVFNGTATGAGSVKNTSTVTYGENFAGPTFGGSYNDVVINSTYGAETTGFDVSGVMSGSGKLTVNGAITGGGSAAMDDGSFVAYASGLEVLDGYYGDLTLNGNTVNEVSVNGLATLNGTSVVTGVLDFAGTTNAQKGGEIEALDNSEIRYNGTADIFDAKNNSYFDLTLYGERAAENAIDKSFSVNGHADISGTQMLGDGIMIAFYGSTNANEVESEVLVPDDGAETTISYSESAAVYGGTYHNLIVNGDHTINKNIIVNSVAKFTGIQSGEGNWVFNGTTAGNGKVNKTAGKVTYGDAFEGEMLDGNYFDLAIDSDKGVASDGFTLDGTLSGNGKLSVNGDITGSGIADMDEESEVEYASGLEIFNGSYGNLVLNENFVSSEVAVKGLATLNGTSVVTGSGVLDFAGKTNAGENVGSLQLEDGSTVKYNSTADLFANDAYYNLSLYGERTAENVIDRSFSVLGHSEITGTQMLGGGIEINFNGTTNAEEVGEVLVLADGAKNTISYGENAAVYSGTYFNLTVNGNHTLSSDLTVNGDAEFNNGTVSGSGDWVFNGTLSGDGKVDNSGSVTYNTEVNAFGGSYNDINANADVVFEDDVTVNGTLTGAEDVTVTFNSLNAGDNGMVDMADGSTVIYKQEGTALLGGNYADLQLDAAGIAANSFNVSGKATLNDVLAVNDDVTVAFNGTTNASELLDGENARINGSDGSTVAYADGAAVFQGLYGDLALADGNIADGEMGYASGKDNGNITVAGDLKLASSGKLAGNFSFTLLGNAVNVESIDQNAGTMTYGNAADVLAGTYANITLKGGIDADHILVYNPLGDMTANGNTVIEEFAVLAGFNGQNLNFNGTTVVDGGIDADIVNNAGLMTNNGSMDVDTLNNTKDFINNGNLTVDAFTNSGSYIDNGIADVDTFDNSGNATVTGSGSTYGIVDNRLGANFTLNGSGNSIIGMNNTGLFNLNSQNTVGTLNNSAPGLVYRDGAMWWMASDEGMSPEFFSDGHNSNFTVLAHMTSLLDADRLDAEFAAHFSRLAPGKVADLAGEGHAVDLHALLGGELDFIGIESEVDELLHGEAPELDEEELADVLSEGEGFSDGFDVALSEIVSE